MNWNIDDMAKLKRNQENFNFGKYQLTKESRPLFDKHDVKTIPMMFVYFHNKTTGKKTKKVYSPFHLQEKISC